jgi:hypothetical protein
MARADGDRSFTNRPGDALDRAVPNVSGREHARRARFEGQRRARKRPAFPRKVTPGQNEPAIVELDGAAKPTGAGFSADHDEDGGGGDPFSLAGLCILNAEGFYTGFAVAVHNSGAEPHFYLGVAFSWVMR